MHSGLLEPRSGYDPRLVLGSLRTPAEAACVGPSTFSDELGTQDEALDPLELAIDLMGIASQPDRLYQRPALERPACAFDVKVFDKRDLVAVGEEIAD